MSRERKRYKYVTARQWGGDDGYCWAVFYKNRPNTPIVSGLTRREVPYYKDKFEKEEEERVKALKNPFVRKFIPPTP